MRVLHIIDGIGPSSARGSELIYEHLKAMAGRGVDVHILTVADNYSSRGQDAWSAREEREHGIKVHCIDTPVLRHFDLGHRVVTRMLYWFNVLLLHRRYRYDVINDFSSTPLMILRTVLMRPFCRTCLVHTLISYGIGFSASRHFPQGMKYLNRVLCLTAHMKRELLRGRPDDGKVTHWAPGVRHQRFAGNCHPSEARRRFRLPGDRLIVLYLGPVKRHKGVFVLTDAACRIPETAGLHFVFACAQFFGAGERERQLKELRECMESCSSPYQIFMGLVDVPSLMSAADIFVLPQLTARGTMAPTVTLMEAMASGRAVVAAGVPGMDELVRDGRNGLLFEPGQPGELVSRIQTLAGDPQLRKELGKKAREDMRETRDLDAAVSCLLEIYEDCRSGRQFSGCRPGMPAGAPAP